MARRFYEVTAAGCAIVSLLAACAVSERRHPTPVRKAPTVIARSFGNGVYVVAKGDTLYSIAFRLGLDYRVLAQQAGIDVPYLIHPGQRLHYGGAAAANQSAGGRAVHGADARPGGAPDPAIPGTANRQDAALGSDGARVATAFAWPASGAVVRPFGPGNKGLDIGGAVGAPVLAAADGEVVYAGDGLRGYGPLLILRHGDLYLTAYGHNQRLLVQEGQIVKARTKIAEIGTNGTEEALLHFEIRREGRPVDPMRLLPHRAASP